MESGAVAGVNAAGLVAYAQSLASAAVQGFIVPDDWTYRHHLHGGQPPFHNPIASTKSVSSLKARYPHLEFHEVRPAQPLFC
jgi:hypothetical protein